MDSITKLYYHDSYIGIFVIVKIEYQLPSSLNENEILWNTT